MNTMMERKESTKPRHNKYLQIKHKGVKTHYTIHRMLSQGNFWKILIFVIAHLIKYN
jgi:hypothetical protein